MNKELEGILEKYKGFPKTRDIIYKAYLIGMHEMYESSKESCKMCKAENIKICPVA